MDSDDHPVCCLCGDVGFPANLFRCATCSHRFQHSYCSNYYGKSTEEAIEVCDWCRSSCTEQVKTGGGQRGSARKTGHDKAGERNYSGGGGGAPSPRPAPRRYKLLKDVMCIKN